MLIFFTSIQKESIGKSPSFPNQQILDITLDWNPTMENQTEPLRPALCDPMNGNWTSKPLDITSVSYNSDGKFLNATFWLNSPIENSPHNLTNREFNILLDVKSGYDPGLTDYASAVVWSKDLNNWTNELAEFSPVEGWRYIKRIPNYTGFFEVQNNYASVSLDLESIGFPERYTLIFTVVDKFERDGISCNFQDVTDFYAVPPPKYNLTVSDNSLFLRKGQEDTLELQMRSDASFNSFASLSWNNPRGLQVDLSPKDISLPPKGITTSLIHIKALDNATVGPYTLLIISSIKPNETLSSGRNPLTGTYAPLIDRTVTPITLVIEEPLGTLDYINIGMNTWGAPIKEFFAIIATVGSAGVFGWVITRFRRKKKRENDRTTRQPV